MRIGDVTTENYKEYLKILGVKDTTNLDKMLGKSAKEMEAEFDHSFEAAERAMVASGFGQEGMLIREGDTSWKKIIPVSDEVRNKLIEVVRRQLMTNKNGMGDYRDGDEIGAVYRNYREGIPPSERLSATYTMSQIVREENQRLYNYIVAHVPGWRPGQTIPADVLKGAVSGESHLDIKA
ncbi:MAG: DUF3879 family protein [Oscillospiraceae bacterium]|nr:DUF3879 family protein [Oscillospiraceae bacterium]